MAHLPIQHLTLYKQGIGYFERSGTVTDAIVTLVVPRAGTNDVLKSLDVVTPRSGQVLNIDYETPEDKQQVLGALPVRLTDRASMVDLLTSLRGSEVTLTLEHDQQVHGRIIGIEASLDASVSPPAVLLQQEAAVQLIPLARLQGLTIHDKRAVTDVSFFLDISQTELTRTTLTVRLAPGTHEVAISYVAPSPTWRVSYRLVGDGQGQARLVGWGLFDNTLDEDLENVTMTLMSGRPISFEYELYESRVPPRPQVSDDPASMEAIGSDPQLRESLSAITHELRTPLTSIKGYADLLMLQSAGTLNQQQHEFIRVMRQSADRMLDLLNDLFAMVRLQDKSREQAAFFYQSGPLGDLKVSNSYFMPVLMGNAEPSYMTYKVETPISVRRGQSAMVPLIDATVSYEQLCIYNDAKMPNHPLLVWRFRNTTGVALEQGPVTIVGAGGYLGEGIVRFTGVDDDIQVPYALEFGILINQETEAQPRTLWKVTFHAEYRQARVHWSTIVEHTYTLTSHINRACTVLIERRDSNRATYDEMPDPVLAIAGHSRWAVDVPANGTATFTVREREIQAAYEDMTSWSTETIDEFRRKNMLSDARCELLQRLVVTRQQITDATTKVTALRAEYQQTIERQEQLRKNLSALGATKREEQIRNRILDDLEGSENRRRAIEAELITVDQQVKQQQTEQQTIVDEVFR